MPMVYAVKKSNHSLFFKGILELCAVLFFSKVRTFNAYHSTLKDEHPLLTGFDSHCC